MLDIFVIMIAIFFTQGQSASLERELEKCEPGYWAATLRNGSALGYACRLCSRCPPGQQQRTPCTNTTDVICEACPEGTYSSRWNSATRCLPCMRCDARQEREQCTPIKNTVCKAKCSAGYYFDQVSLGCKRCSPCSAGFGLRMYECTQHADSDPALQCAEEVDFRTRMSSTSRRRMADKYPMPSEFRGYANTVLDTGRTSRLPTIALLTQPPNGKATDRLETTGTFGRSGIDLASLAAGQDVRVSKRQDDDEDQGQRHLRTSVAHVSGTPSTTPSEAPAEQTESAVSLTTILIVMGIILGSGVVSFATTAVTCHFLIKRGVVKTGNATVACVRERPATTGWLALSQNASVETLPSPRIDVI